MGNEQTILLGPEEELTSVRERLEKTGASRIILVIPAQTQLRSHVGWRLIHARMRELGKELLVISPDRQVRAVARAAGFQVAETQQDVPSNRPRLGGGTRPSTTNARGASRSRPSASRGEPESRASQSRRLTSHTSNRPSTPSRSGYQEDEETLARLQRREVEASQRSQSVPATFFEEPEEPLDPAYDFSLRTTPAVSPKDEDESTEFKNTYEVDYQTAQTILKAAKEGVASQEQAKAKPSQFEEIEEDVPDLAHRSTGVIESRIEDLGEIDSIDLPEIHSDQAFERPGGQPREQSRRRHPGSGSIQPNMRHSPRAPRPSTQDLDDDDDILALPEKPTRDAADFVRPSRGLNRGQRPSQALDPRPSQRPSQVLDPRPSQRPSQALDPRPSQRPSQVLDPRPSQRPSQALDPRPSQRPSQALDPRPSQRPSQALDPRPSQRPSQAGANMRAVAGGQRSPKQPSRPSRAPMRQQPMSRRPVSQKNSRVMAIILVALTLLIVVAAALFYFVPAATVTIALSASPYTQSVHFNATASPQAQVSNNVLAHTLEQQFSASDQAKPTGTTQVGNAQAHGLVTFTNSGQADVTIPTNTLLTTASGIQFATGAEAVVLSKGSLPMPVVAQVQGESGNVGRNTITVIPPASLNSIAQHSHLNPASVTASNLTVTNDAATNGGGAATVAAASQDDVQALTKILHQQIQQEVQTWQNAQTHSGDVLGPLVPNVLASSKPLNEEQVSVTPAVGQPVVNSTTFSGTLTVHVSLLIVRAADLQKAAGLQLNVAALQLHPAKVLATQLPITLAHVQSKSSQDGKTLAISADANGELIPQLDRHTIASSITNQGFSQAAHDLKNGIGIPSSAKVQDVQFSIFPSFLSILPIQAGRIQIIIKPIQATPPPAPINNGT